ncbi:pH-sensitive chloride channel 2-like [Arctopsyche grandis]|uniref:pH-sensitive chloride channel 2-like n=1 Tax=Arctopsyche grandis TaxID=121162 RepID=UPI00406D9C26
MRTRRPPLLLVILLTLAHAQNSTIRSPGGAECGSIENGDKLTQSEFMARLVNSCRYDKLLRPSTDTPVSVLARVYVYFMQATDAHDMHFKLHFLLQLRYFDPRLAYKTYSPNRKVIVGEDQLRTGIWTPHVFLSNEQKSTIMGTDSKDVLVSISPDGVVLFSRRIQAVIYCWMNLQKFPFDEQVCSMNFESWMYSSSEVELHWEELSPVTLAPELHLSEFTLLDRWINESLVYSDWTDPRHGGFIGNFSALTFSFKLAREMGYYLMDYYIPSMMIVAISWVSFWLQADQSAPRITLGTSTMLSFITLASSQGRTLPKVSYIKASEVWFLGCTGFIFGSLVEFAFVNIIWRRKQVVELKKVNSKYILKSTLTPRPARKDLGQSQSTLTKSHSCSSLDEAPGVPNLNRPAYNNYLTVHSFPSQLNIPTITTQSYDDLVASNGSRESGGGAVSVSVDSEGRCAPQSSGQLPPHGTWTTMTPQEIAMWIDTRSRLVFPIAFLMFNVVYFAVVYFL